MGPSLLSGANRRASISAGAACAVMQGHAANKVATEFVYLAPTAPEHHRLTVCVQLEYVARVLARQSGKEGRLERQNAPFPICKASIRPLGAGIPAKGPNWDRYSPGTQCQTACVALCDHT